MSRLPRRGLKVFLLQQRHFMSTHDYDMLPDYTTYLAASVLSEGKPVGLPDHLPLESIY